ncbi:MAG: PLP-dependent aminotransferase family protein [Gemmataceae bacterium]
MPPATIRLSESATRTPEQPISYFMQQALENPGLISLAAGLVDEMSLPTAEVATTLAELMAMPQHARSALQYGTTQGYLPLRTKLCDRFATADGTTPEQLNISPEDVIVTNGSQQLLYLLSEVLLDPGDIVITEAPSYFVYHGTLASRGARVLAIPMDDRGMRIDALEEQLERLDSSGELNRLKLIYTVDYFQNPSGLSLSLERRKQLMELVRRYSRNHRILILEDAAYRELRFDGDDVPSIKRFDSRNEHVIYTTTFSKPLTPGLKTGYGVMPRELVAPILRLKGNHDFGSANLAQHLIDRLLSNGMYDRHVADLRMVYRSKSVAMLDALQAEFREWPEVRWTRPSGGMYVWLKFPAHVRTGMGSPFLHAAMHEGVLYIPGEFCHVTCEGEPLPTCECRLCFGVATPVQIREAVHRLARAAKPLLQPCQTAAV